MAVCSGVSGITLSCARFAQIQRSLPRSRHRRPPRRSTVRSVLSIADRPVVARCRPAAGSTASRQRPSRPPAPRAISSWRIPSIGFIVFTNHNASAGNLRRVRLPPRRAFPRKPQERLTRALQDFPRRLCRHVRPDHRRQGPPCRYRSRHRGREGLHHLWRGGEVRRRQGHPRRHGPVAVLARRGRRRHRHHQRADRRPLGHRQGRRRHQGRQDRRHRQGRQSRRPARRRHHHRPGHRGDRRRGQDPHRRRPRHPHPFHRPAADRRGALFRRHHHARRRHRPGDRHQRHHLHARPLAPRPHDPGRRRLPHEPRLHRQGQRLAAGRPGGAGRAPAPWA